MNLINLDEDNTLVNIDLSNSHYNHSKITTAGYYNTSSMDNNFVRNEGNKSTKLNEMYISTPKEKGLNRKKSIKDMMFSTFSKPFSYYLGYDNKKINEHHTQSSAYYYTTTTPSMISSTSTTTSTDSSNLTAKSTDSFDDSSRGSGYNYNGNSNSSHGNGYDNKNNNGNSGYNNKNNNNNSRGSWYNSNNYKNSNNSKNSHDNDTFALQDNKYAKYHSSLYTKKSTSHEDSNNIWPMTSYQSENVFEINDPLTTENYCSSPMSDNNNYGHSNFHKDLLYSMEIEDEVPKKRWSSASKLLHESNNKNIGYWLADVFVSTAKTIKSKASLDNLKGSTSHKKFNNNSQNQSQLSVLLESSEGNRIPHQASSPSSPSSTESFMNHPINPSFSSTLSTPNHHLSHPTSSSSSSSYASYPNAYQGDPLNITKPVTPSSPSLGQENNSNTNDQNVHPYPNSNKLDIPISTATTTTTTTKTKFIETSERQKKVQLNNEKNINTLSAASTTTTTTPNQLIANPNNNKTILTQYILSTLSFGKMKSKSLPFSPIRGHSLSKSVVSTFCSFNQYNNFQKEFIQGGGEDINNENDVFKNSYKYDDIDVSLDTTAIELKDLKHDQDKTKVEDNSFDSYYPDKKLNLIYYPNPELRDGGIELEREESKIKERNSIDENENNSSTFNNPLVEDSEFKQTINNTNPTSNQNSNEFNDDDDMDNNFTTVNTNTTMYLSTPNKTYIDSIVTTTPYNHDFETLSNLLETQSFEEYVC